MKALRNTVLFLILVAAAAGALAVAFIDPPMESRQIETPVTLPAEPAAQG